MKKQAIAVAVSLSLVAGIACADSMRLQLIARSEQVASTAIDSVIRVTGDTADRFRQLASGKFEFGSGSAAPDTNLYRSAADTLTTDDNVTVGGDLSGDGGDQLVGFLHNHVTASTTALTAAQCGSTVISAAGVVQPLPEASTVLGCRYTFVAGTDDDYDIDPADATDLLGRASVDGAAIAGSAGDEYRLTDTGSSLTVQAVSANLWAVVSHNGPITDVN